MKFTLSWLSDYLEHGSSLDRITEKLTSIGFEVEEIIDNSSLSKFIVVQVLEVTNHYNADKLKICKVTNGHNIIQVVCGASNVRPGLMTVLASVGSVLPKDNSVITYANIRGVDSFGMLCSKEELNLSTVSNEGIIELSDDYEVGECFFSCESVIDVNITINRGDCLGVYGIARELSAAGIGKLKPLRESNYIVDDIAFSPIDIALNSNCIVAGRYIYGVKNKESPKWLKRILYSVGITPVTFITDISNYIMLALNQPIFIYKATVIKEKLILDKCQDNISNFITKMGKIVTIPKDTTIIIDNDGNIHAVAGIEQSDKNDCSLLETTDIFLQSAWFDPIDITLSSRSIGLITESSYRYERYVDSKLLKYALDLTTEMIIGYCGGRSCKMIFKEKGDYNNHNEIIFDYEEVRRLGNIDISNEDIYKILINLGFIIKRECDVWKVIVPSWRSDVKLSADIVEEVLRIYGYNNVKEEVVCALKLYKYDSFHDKLRCIMTSQGLDEVITWSFMNSQIAKKFGYDDNFLITINNPINSNFNVMRPSIIPNLMQVVVDNLLVNIQDNFAFFEIGAVYYKATNDDYNKDCQVISGIRYGKNLPRNLYDLDRNVDIFDIKSDVLNLLQLMNIDCSSLHLEPCDNLFYHPVKSTNLYLKDIFVGHFGELHPTIMSSYKLKKTAICFEIILHNSLLSKIEREEFCDYRHQVIKRDFAFIVDKNIKVGSLINIVKQSNPDFIISVIIFDLYEGEDIGKGNLSVALSVTFRSGKHTFSDLEIKDISQNIIEAVKKNAGGILRE